MFSKNDILEQLRNGADASDIAQKMADEINAAVRDYEAEQEAAKRKTAVREDARNMVKTMSKFFSAHMGEDEMNDSEIDEATDAVMELMDSLRELKENLDNANIHVKIKKAPDLPAGEPNGHRSDEDVIRSFLNSL